MLVFDREYISRMSSGVFEDGPSDSRSKKNISKSTIRGNSFKRNPYGNFKRRTTPPVKSNGGGSNPTLTQKPIFSKNFKIPMKDPRSRIVKVESPKSPVQNRPPLFTRNYKSQPKPLSPAGGSDLPPKGVAVSSHPLTLAPAPGPSNMFPPDFSMPPPSTATPAPRLVVNSDHHPSTPNSSSSPVFR